MNYTKKSRAEFDNLWNSAYLAIEKYAGGQLDVDLALANLIAQMAAAEQQTKDLEAAMNSLKNATSSYATSATNDMANFNKVLNETKTNMQALTNTSWSTTGQDPRYYNTGYTSTYNSAVSSGMSWSDYEEQMKKKNMPHWRTPKYHNGGIVEGIAQNPHGEVLAKLLKGEVVATADQARNFMENTLPKLTANAPITNNSVAPVINIGDIVVNGDADSSTIDKLKAVRESIVNDVFKVVNQQTNIYNGRTLRSV